MAFKIPDFTSKATLISLAVALATIFVINRVAPGFGDAVRRVGT